LFQERENVAEGAGPASAEGSGIKNRIEIGICESERRESEVGIFLGGETQRVEMGEGVAEGAVGKEEIVDAGLGKDVAEFGRLGGGSGSGSGSGSELAT